MSCNPSAIKVGGNQWVTLEAFAYLGGWFGSVDCQDGNGFHNFSQNFVTTIRTALAFGETEAFGGGVLTDAHAVPAHALDSSLTFTGWYGETCVFNNTQNDGTKWHPTLAFGGWGNDSGSWGC